MTEPAPCPTCLRPRHIDGEVFDSARHCPRSHRSADRYVISCLTAGLEARDRQLATNVRLIKTLDGLLVRAREVLLSTEQKVTDVIDRLDQETRP